MIRRVKIDTETAEGGNLNLTPFLDLMMVLIPFLMLSTSFFVVVVTTAKLPTPVSSPKLVPTTPPFDLVVQMPKDSIKVFLNPNGSSDKPLLALPLDGQGTNETALARFHQTLVEIKSRFPGETRLALDPAGMVPLEHLQQVMDQATLHSDQDGALSGKPLFPNIALKGVYAP